MQEDGKNYHSTALKFPDSFAKPSKWRSLFGNIDWQAFSRTSLNKKVNTYFHLSHIYGLIIILLSFYNAYHYTLIFLSGRSELVEFKVGVRAYTKDSVAQEV